MIEFKNNLIDGTFTLDGAIEYALAQCKEELISLGYAQSLNDKEHIEEYENRISIWESELDSLDRVKEVNGELRFKTKTEYLKELNDKLEKCDNEELKSDINSRLHSVMGEEYSDEQYDSFTSLSLCGEFS